MYMDYSKILSKIKPTLEDTKKISKSANYIISYLKNNLKNTDVVAGGSFSKGTYLKGNFDVDIFVRFKDKLDYSNTLEDKIREFCKNEKIEYERVHGSRDYFQLTYNKIFFEIVPVKYVTKSLDVENVTDMSPLHVFWAKDKLNQKLKDDILLAKQFCKANKIYGAESYINGFSGHVIDILIINYNGFENLLKEASNWSDRTIIDIEHTHKNVLKSMNKAKLISPLIIVDPIDKNRNASAALSHENYEKFIDVCKDFLKSPSESFFKIKKMDLNLLRKNIEENQILVYLKIIPMEGKQDVVGSKIVKSYEYIKKELDLNCFDVIDSGWEFDRELSQYYFYVKDVKLPEFYVRKGPKLSNKLNCENFKKVHKKTFEVGEYLCSNIKRNFREPIPFIENLFTEEYVKSRIKDFVLEVYKK
jgi:tRNA nucleotidyltransferase (CCA-adding enzyme)